MTEEVRRVHELAELLSREQGKPRVESYTMELLPTADALKWIADAGPDILSDERVPMQVEARCWCGARATHNARVVNGQITYEGETVVVGDTGDGDQEQPLFGDVVRYELLCRRHYTSGELGA